LWKGAQLALGLCDTWNSPAAVLRKNMPNAWDAQAAASAEPMAIVLPHDGSGVEHQ
jgi:hypothetical protein